MARLGLEALLLRPICVALLAAFLRANPLQQFTRRQGFRLGFLVGALGEFCRGDYSQSHSRLLTRGDSLPPETGHNPSAIVTVVTILINARNPWAF